MGPGVPWVCGCLGYSGSLESRTFGPRTFGPQSVWTIGPHGSWLPRSQLARGPTVPRLWGCLGPGAPWVPREGGILSAPWVPGVALVRGSLDALGADFVDALGPWGTLGLWLLGRLSRGEGMWSVPGVLVRRGVGWCGAARRRYILGGGEVVGAWGSRAPRRGGCGAARPRYTLERVPEPGMRWGTAWTAARWGPERGVPTRKRRIRGRCPNS